MNFTLNHSWQSLQNNPTAAIEEICVSLQSAYARAWLHHETETAVCLPLPELALGTPKLAVNLPRRWAVTDEPGGQKLVYRMRNLTRHDEAAFHPLVAQLARCETYITAVETAVFELATRLMPWFGQAPTGFDWVVSLVGAPVVPDLGYWLSTITYALDESLTDHGQLLPVVTSHYNLPIFWIETAANAVKWELAVLLGLTVPGSYSPPTATRDQPYGSFQNPFLIVLDIWGSGAMLESAFNGDIVTICIDSKFLQSLV
jgi:hypothetical protein